MANNLFETTYNPDVLTCLANLSNDEVFTPPNVVNDMLDMLPQEIFSDPSATFLDPVCKSGVFLREIAKRLIVGLETQIPNLQERLDHIFKKQLYGIAITELTSLMARRSLYCSKAPNRKYSVVRFGDIQGNVRFKVVDHTFAQGKCIYCGAPESLFGQRDSTGKLETHAYEFIHTNKPEEIWNMKFDVIIGNPPYQLDTGGAGRQAKPIYPLFVEQAKKLNPRFLVMIIPSRWFAGGMALDEFRETMMNDSHITRIVDYSNAKDCFPQNSISGGVSYFLRDRDHSKPCYFTNISNGVKVDSTRALNEFPVLVRYNEAVSILRKVQSVGEPTVATITSPLMPFGLGSAVRGESTKHRDSDLRLLSSNGYSYLDKTAVTKGAELINKYKVFLSITSAEHAGEPRKDGTYGVITSSLRTAVPGDICTHSYFAVGCFDKEETAKNLEMYLRTKFARFLILQAMSSIHLSKLTFVFLPLVDLNVEWTDELLYQKYGLNKDEIAFIESMIHEMGRE